MIKIKILTESRRLELEECTKGHIYLIHSRNLSVGVYNGKEGFIGIRDKFDFRYLDTEYHQSKGGTVRVLQDLGSITDTKIKIQESYPDSCKYCGYLIEADKGSSMWAHIGETDCVSPIPVVRQYTPLFEYLEDIEKEIEVDYEH